MQHWPTCSSCVVWIQEEHFICIVTFPFLYGVITLFYILHVAYTKHDIIIKTLFKMGIFYCKKVVFIHNQPKENPQWEKCSNKNWSIFQMHHD